MTPHAAGYGANGRAPSNQTGSVTRIAAQRISGSGMVAGRPPTGGSE
jgi:hypothetical protein